MKIPIYEQQVGLTAETPEGMGPMAPTGPLGSMEAAGLPGKALEQAGATLTQIGGEVIRHMRHAKQLNDLTNANYDALDHLTGLQNLVKEYDPEVQVKTFAQGAQDWFDNQYKNLADPEVQAAFKNHWTTWYFSTLGKVKNEAEKQKGFVYLETCRRIGREALNSKLRPLMTFRGPGSGMKPLRCWTSAWAPCFFTRPRRRR